MFRRTRTPIAWLLALVFLTAACGSESEEGAQIADRGTPAPTPEVTPAPTPDATPEPTPEDTDEPATPEPEAEPQAQPDPEPEPDALRAPQAGDYDFRSEGTRKMGSLGQPQPYEYTGTLEVAHHDGDETTFLSRTEEGESEMRFRNHDGQVLLVSIRIDEGLQRFEGSFDPPQVILRAPIRVGDAWENSWTLNGTNGTSHFEILREEEISAFGQTWHAFVLESTWEFSGDLNGTQHLVAWYVPELGLEVLQETSFEGEYQGVSFETSGTRTLTSRP